MEIHEEHVLDREVKQWIILRKDLKMRKGKMITQGAHASMKVLTDRLIRSGDLRLLETTLSMQKWLDGAFTKICLGVDSEEDLVSAYRQAQEAGLPCAMITDSGITEFNGVPTRTAIAIGPCYAKDAVKIVRDLSLL